MYRTASTQENGSGEVNFGNISKTYKMFVESSGVLQMYCKSNQSACYPFRPRASQTAACAAVSETTILAASLISSTLKRLWTTSEAKTRKTFNVWSEFARQHIADNSVAQITRGETTTRRQRHNWRAAGNCWFAARSREIRDRPWARTWEA